MRHRPVSDITARAANRRLRRCAIALGCVIALLTTAAFAIPARTLAAGNPIVAENQQPGSAGWRPGPLRADDTTGQIKAYLSATSVDQNQSVTLHVSVNPEQPFSIDVYRVGWYGGLGGRLRLHAGPIPGVHQNPCVPDPTTGVIDCNWSPSYTLTVPTDWTSGFYIVQFTNADGYQNYAPFVVKDGRSADFLYQQAAATDQAYNNYPEDGRTGKSLYTFNSFGANTVSGDPRAVKVSFDRPYAGLGAGGFFQFEVDLVRWLERSGYDVTYSTNLDTHANGARVLGHKGFLSPAHDEYWSKEMFDAVEAARDAGVNVAFFGADAMSAQVRFEPSGAGTPNRVMVAYKNAALDPIQGPTTTVSWRYPPVNRAEQTLRGIQFVDGVPYGNNVDYVVTNSSHWAYAGTGFKDGDVVPGIVGYEMDRYMSEYPAASSTNFTLLSHSPFTTATGHAEHANSSIYQAASGAWVFSTGTLAWSWALDDFDHTLADARIQRTTANILDAFLVGAPRSVQSLKVTAPQAVVAGSPFSVAITAVDGLGNPVTSYAGTIHFGTSDASSGVVLPPDTTLSGGQGTFSVTLMGSGSQTITATDVAAPTVTGAATLTVSNTTAGSLGVTGPTAATAGQPFTITVTARDANANPAPGYSGTVHFASSDASPGVVLPPDATLGDGQGSFSVTLIASGVQTITASDAANKLSTTIEILVNPGSASRLVVASTAVPIAGVSFPFTVVAQDQFGNTATSYAGTIEFRSSDTSPGTVLPADSTLTKGERTFAATLTKAGAQTITVSDAATNIAGTLSMTVRAGSATRLAVSTAARPTAGVGFAFTVRAQDAFGNTDGGYAGRVRFTSTDTASGVVLPQESALTNGERGFSATLIRAGPQTISAFDGLNPGLGGSITVDVKAAPAKSFLLQPATSTPTAGTGFTFTIRAQDPFGNTDQAYAGRVHFTSTDTASGVVLPADSALANGQGTFQATLVRAGSQKLMAVDISTAGITGNAVVTVKPAAASSITLAVPTTVTAGQSFTFKVTLYDRFGNQATGYRGTARFRTSDFSPLVALPPNYTFSAGDAGAHTFSATLWTPPSQTISVNDLADPGLSGTSPAITVRLPLPLL